MKVEEMKDNQKAFWGTYEDAVHEWIGRIDKQSVMKRLWAGDAALWKKEADHQKEIKNRLGWLTVAEDMRENLDEIHAFVEDVRKEGYAHVMLLGMGGSSLAPELFQSVFGNKKGYPELLVLDSTDPARVLDLEKKINPVKTLFIVSSKSGGTIELVSFYKYFFKKVQDADQNPGRHFVAITDPGSPLEALAKKSGFRKVFLNPENVGGRFSALTYFGLVPAALIGVDLNRILDSADEMMTQTFVNVPAEQNAAVPLGLGMAVLAEMGRDKLTILAPKELESLGDWAEQLIAESTGKEELGVVPIVREPLAKNLVVYSKDRFFLIYNLEGADNAELEAFADKLKKAGQPYLVITLKDKSEIGGEFFRLELATALACIAMKVNAFDQPAVQSAKDKAKNLLKIIEKGESLPMKVSNDPLKKVLGTVQEGDYVALLAFLPYRDAIQKILEGARDKIRDSKKTAVTIGFGPRYLHSTGQLHKGGANNGVFVVITANHTENAAIPGDKFDFAQLELAQAIGDLEALEGNGRRVYHLRLNDLTDASLADFKKKIDEALL